MRANCTNLSWNHGEELGKKIEIACWETINKCWFYWPFLAGTGDNNTSKRTQYTFNRLRLRLSISLNSLDHTLGLWLMTWAYAWLKSITFSVGEVDYKYYNLTTWYRCRNGIVLIIAVIIASTYSKRAKLDHDYEYKILWHISNT